MDEINKEKIKIFFELAEKIIRNRQLVSQIHLQDEMDKFLNCIMQGKETIQTYERRELGITDEEWDKAKVDFFNAVGKKYES